MTINLIVDILCVRTNFVAMNRENGFGCTATATGTCRRAGRAPFCPSTRFLATSESAKGTYPIMTDSQYIDRRTAAKSYRPAGHVRLNLKANFAIDCSP